jgi:hypothetical protein
VHFFLFSNGFEANNAAIVESFATKEVYDGIGAALLVEGLSSKDLALLLSIFQQLSNFGKQHRFNPLAYDCTSFSTQDY